MTEATRDAEPFSINTARGASIQEMVAIHRIYIHEVLTLDERKEFIYNMKRKQCK
ncbi:MAG: hypothetical protein WCJ39_00690 [bacterium]